MNKSKIKGLQPVAMMRKTQRARFLDRVENAKAKRSSGGAITDMGTRRLGNTMVL